MKKLESFGVQELDTKEIKKIVGGKFWPSFWPAYIISELLSGFQDGMSTDCSEFECPM